jgi:hypothetical protein
MTLLEGVGKIPYICNNKNQHFLNNSNRQDYGIKANLLLQNPMHSYTKQQKNTNETIHATSTPIAYSF